MNINPGSLVSPTPTIEDQIDEYLDYKRGLNKVSSRPFSDHKEGKAGQDVKFADLNFKKKLQAINDFPMPADEAHFDYLDYLERRPEMKKLLTALKYTSKDEINQVTQLIETFKRF